MSDTVRAVTVDLWHTLLYLPPDEEERYMAGQSRAAVRALAEAPPAPGAEPVSDDQLPQIYHRELAEAVRAAETGRTVTPVAQFRAMARSAGRVPDVPRYLEYLTSLVHGTPFVRAPGANEFLRSLRDRGFRVAVISNTVGEPGATLRPAFHRLGFNEYIEHYTFSDEQPWAKPAPEIFRMTLATLGAEPASAVHVGDGWSDMEGAHRAGYRSRVLYRGLADYAPSYGALFRGPPGSEVRPEFEVTDLTEIPALAERVLGRSG